MAERAPQHTKYADRLNKLDYAELHRLARDVAATMATPGWEHLSRLIAEQRTDLLEGMVSGGAREHHEYVRATAQAAGIDIALSAGPTVLNVANRREQEEKSKLREVA